ncbi:hypothetical protein F5Y06DRAFT_260485 [Hypoxylon sp. FL0890]|nr:hypothetical protein F5Y06DRAFT_260485 [Hypoxylon sp. FL0890]
MSRKPVLTVLSVLHITRECVSYPRHAYATPDPSTMKPWFSGRKGARSSNEGMLVGASANRGFRANTGSRSRSGPDRFFSLY